MKKNLKKTIWLLLLIANIVSCGGGNGGSTGGNSSEEWTPIATNPLTPPPDSAPSIIPDVPSTPPEQIPIPELDDKNETYDKYGRIIWRDKTLIYKKDNSHNQSKNIYDDSGNKVDGSTVKVAVIDIGFNTMDTKLKNKMRNIFDGTNSSSFGRLEILDTSNLGTGISTTGEDHGILVAEMVGGGVKTNNGVAKKIKIIGADISEMFSEGKYSPYVTKEIYEELYNNKKIKIFNQSFGTIKKLTEYNEFNYEAVINNGGDILGFYKKAVKEGALFVWAAGNRNFSDEENITNDPNYSDNPSLNAGLPYFEPELEKGWINVVGLYNKNEKEITFEDQRRWEDLDVFSNAGLAANWSVTAVSEMAHDCTTLGSCKRSTGSSFAAPIVTGTAALLKHKYSWMDGSLIRQTILSTATDIGAEGVDKVFGWGLLNIDKALKGPALFDKRLALGDHVITDISENGVWSFENDISGDAGLKKKGIGTLELKGILTYTGETWVQNGTLKIKGKSYNSGFRSSGGASTLSLHKNVLVKSVINEGSNVEIAGEGVTISEDYKATPDSKTTFDLGANLYVKGKTELDGSKVELTSLKDGEAQYITAKGTETEIIKSDSGIIGSFSEVKTSEMLEGKVETNEDDGKVTATLSRKNVEEYAAGLELSDSMTMDVAENTEATFRALDAEIEKGNLADVKRFASAAGQLQVMALSKDELDKLSGHIYGSAQALTFQHSQTINKDLSNRLVMLGTLDNVGDNAGLWITGIGARGKLKQDGFGSGDTDIFGGQVGVDKKFGNFILGGALSYSTSEAKFDRYGGKSTGDGFGVSVYGRYDLEIPVYLQGRLGMGFITSNVERDIMLTDVTSQRGKIEHKDKVFSGYLETGYDAEAGEFVVTPYVGISHDTVSRGSFTEENSPLGLTAPKATFKQTSGHVGLRVGKSVEWSGGSKTTFQGYVSHQAAFNKEDLSFEAAYTGLSGAKFTVKGIGLSRHQTWGGLGVLTEINPNFAWYINYDGKLSQKGNNNMFTTGFRINF